MAKKQKTYNSFYTVAPTSEFDGKLGGLIGRAVVSFLAFLLVAAIGGGAFYALGLADMAGLGTIGMVAGGVVAFVFLFFALAWSSNIRTRWTVSHTRINGYRLKFVGKTWNLAWTYMKWFFCSVFTLFIFTLWLPIKAKQWQAKNTVIDEDAPVMESHSFYNVAPAFSMNR